MMQRGIAPEPTEATVITILPKLDPAGVRLPNMEAGRRYIEDGALPVQRTLCRGSPPLSPGSDSSLRVFLTGGTGFVGNALAAALRQRGDEVVALGAVAGQGRCAR